MANDIKGHISFAERQKWNKTATDLSSHTAAAAIHVPAPIKDGSAYYLGCHNGTIGWYRVPKAVITTG